MKERMLEARCPSLLYLILSESFWTIISVESAPSCLWLSQCHAECFNVSYDFCGCHESTSADRKDFPSRRFGALEVKDLLKRLNGNGNDLTYVDLSLVIVDVGDVIQGVDQKSNEGFATCLLKLADRTGFVEYTLWHDEAVNFKGTKGDQLTILSALLGISRGDDKTKVRLMSEKAKPAEVLLGHGARNASEVKAIVDMCPLLLALFIP